MIDVTNRNSLAVMGSVLGQVTIEPVSYQTVWDKLMDQCADMIGYEECVKLLGYTPFVCPVIPTGPAIQIGGRDIGSGLLWFALGFAGGMLVSRLLR